MYAVIIAGGKQYKVQKDSVILIEKQANNLGDQLEFTEVLLASNGTEVVIGMPYVANCIVKATVESHGKQDKIKIIKFKRRKHHMKHIGHRQQFTKIKINEIIMSLPVGAGAA